MVFTVIIPCSDGLHLTVAATNDSTKAAKHLERLKARQPFTVKAERQGTSKRTGKPLNSCTTSGTPRWVRTRQCIMPTSLTHINTTHSHNNTEIIERSFSLLQNEHESMFTTTGVQSKAPLEIYFSFISRSAHLLDRLKDRMTQPAGRTVKNTTCFTSRRQCVESPTSVTLQQPMHDPTSCSSMVLTH